MAWRVAHPVNSIYFPTAFQRKSPQGSPCRDTVRELTQSVSCWRETRVTPFSNDLIVSSRLRNVSIANTAVFERITRVGVIPRRKERDFTEKRTSLTRKQKTVGNIPLISWLHLIHEGRDNDDFYTVYSRRRRIDASQDSSMNEFVRDTRCQKPLDWIADIRPCPGNRTGRWRHTRGASTWRTVALDSASNYRQPSSVWILFGGLEEGGYTGGGMWNKRTFLSTSTLIELLHFGDDSNFYTYHSGCHEISTRVKFCFICETDFWCLMMFQNYRLIGNFCNESIYFMTQNLISN